MEIKNIAVKIKNVLSKYKYVLIILAVGLIFMLVPTEKKTNTQEVQTNIIQKDVSINDELCNILKCIDGAGDVRVMLTLSCGKETIYYESEDTDAADSGSSVRKNAVIITDSNRNQTGLIRYIGSEKYLGAIVVCEGADSAYVRECIIDAVSKVTGLRSDKIAVLKMK
jgi:stage III sporulation protein AG